MFNTCLTHHLTGSILVEKMNDIRSTILLYNLIFCKLFYEYF